MMFEPFGGWLLLEVRWAWDCWYFVTDRGYKHDKIVGMEVVHLDGAKALQFIAGPVLVRVAKP